MSFFNKTILLTGHTGFKGAWLAEWLLLRGARIVGYSKDIPTDPALFSLLNLADRLDDHRGDIREKGTVAKLVRDTQPDYVFHLAAQPLVRYSYREPLETYETNVLGTAYLLDALRALEKPCAAVLVSTDKCYENREWKHAYRESDPMGGHDPYNSSKGAAELVIQGYRQSYFQNHPVRLASARADNVIGGGDFSPDRILPDCIRALANQEPIPVRNPAATRPWQHVLEPLSGYLRLAEKLSEQAELSPSYNFGPALASNRPVEALVEKALQYWKGTWEDQSDPHAPPEATLLNLASDLAFHDLHWTPRWNFETTIEKTLQGYQAWHNQADLLALTRQQIEEYEGS